jgi:ribonuclease BN (tRNA processing enzyme)
MARTRRRGSCEGGVVEIRFVGSGDAFGSGGRFQTCIHLHGDGYTALVDCGATSLTAMKAQHVDPGEVDAVMLSHLHGDHLLAHVSGLLRELPAMLAENDAAAAAQRHANH